MIKSARLPQWLREEGGDHVLRIDTSIDGRPEGGRRHPAHMCHPPALQPLWSLQSCMCERCMCKRHLRNGWNRRSHVAVYQGLCSVCVG